MANGGTVLVVSAHAGDVVMRYYPQVTEVLA